MGDFKREISILWKRNGFWIVLAFAISLLFSGFFETNSLEADYKSLLQTTNDLNMMAKTDKKYDEDTSIDKKFFEENDPLFKKMAKKYKFEKYGDFDYENASEDEAKEFDQYNLENGEYLSTLRNYKYFSNSLKLKSNMNFNDSMYFMGIIVVVILGFLFSSIEHATSYYEFSRMYPWTKRKDFLMKIGLGLIIIFSFVVLGSLLNYMIIRTSNFDILKSASGLGQRSLRNFGFLSAIYLVILSVGFMAGNILGHIGLGILTFLSVDIVDTINGNIVSLIKGEDYYYNSIGNWINSRFSAKGRYFDRVFRVILRPAVNYENTLASILGLIIFALICFVIAFLLIDRIKTEKSGMMILLKPIEYIAKILIITLLASGGAMIFQSAVFEGFSIINFVIFAILIYVFTKIFNILFNLKLKV